MVVDTQKKYLEQIDDKVKHYISLGYEPDDFLFLMISLNGDTKGSQFLSEITSYLSSKNDYYL